jgi:hypothetical protein
LDVNYIQCFARDNGMVLRIDTYLDASTNSANNLSMDRFTTAGYGVNECSNHIAYGYTSSGGHFVHSDGSSSNTAPGTPGNYTFDSPGNYINAAYDAYQGFTQADVESLGWVDSVY